MVRDKHIGANCRRFFNGTENFQTISLREAFGLFSNEAFALVNPLGRDLVLLQIDSPESQIV